ncbi:MAG: hypothetical protein MPK62_01900 [Alphaproteobacteria bacterium]|nr:hypothetical protein [Alphaproteobacteria bacterium]
MAGRPYRIRCNESTVRKAAGVESYKTTIPAFIAIKLGLEAKDVVSWMHLSGRTIRMQKDDRGVHTTAMVSQGKGTMVSTLPKEVVTLLGLSGNDVLAWDIDKEYSAEQDGTWFATVARSEKPRDQRDSQDDARDDERDGVQDPIEDRDTGYGQGVGLYEGGYEDGYHAGDGVDPYGDAGRMPDT